MTDTTETQMPNHTIASLCTRSHAISLEKGWVTAEGDPRTFATTTNLHHSELSEAMEEFRAHRGLDETYYEGPDGTRYSALKEGADSSGYKPCGIPVELADFVIRVCQWAGTSQAGAMLQVEFDVAMDRLPPAADAVLGFDDALAEMHMYVSIAHMTSRAVKTPSIALSARIRPLAAALAVAFAFCKDNGIYLWAAIDEKEAFNRTRSFKHGGKAC